MSYPEKQRSNLWFLLPIFVGLLGGIIAFLFLRKNDPEKAKNVIYLSLVLLLRDFLMIFMIGSEVPGLNPGFNVNI